MSNDQLQREYGVLLGVTGPILLSRIDAFRRIATLLGPGKAADYMESQAVRAEHTLVSLGEKFNEQHRT